MSERLLSEQLRDYLEANFPGSSIDDTYYFVAFASSVDALIPEAAIDSVARQFAQHGSWLITVGVDPRSYVQHRSVEQRTVVYQPDWNIEAKLVEWVVELGGGDIDIRGLLGAETSPGAAAFVDSGRNLIFNANARRVHARDRQALDDFLRAIPEMACGKEPT